MLHTYNVSVFLHHFRQLGISLRPYSVSIGPTLYNTDNSLPTYHSLSPTTPSPTYLLYPYSSSHTYTPTTPPSAYSYATTVTPHSTTSLFLNHPVGGVPPLVELPQTAAALSLAPPALPSMPRIPTVPAVARLPALSAAVPTVPAAHTAGPTVPTAPTAVPTAPAVNRLPQVLARQPTQAPR